MEQSYDYAGWQARLGLTNLQAAHALDISPSMFATLKRKVKGRKLYAWAAYGIERAEFDKRRVADSEDGYTGRDC